jgi:transcriptional regulator with XRE-family HTH domain
MLFGTKLRMMRARRHMTQTELSALSGLDRTVLSRIETNVVRPEGATEQAIRKALSWDDAADDALDQLGEVVADVGEVA